MIPFVFLTLLLALTLVYALFLERVRQGLDILLQQKAAPVTPAIDETALLPRISVIVPSRDEADRLPMLVASLKEQDYPDGRVEFLIVDDHSRDDTLPVVHSAVGDDPRFRIIQLHQEVSGGKKSAIDQAIGIASGGVIVTTDADCVHQPQWLRAMARPFRDGADLVAGPVMIHSTATRFARLQSLEFLGLMGVGAGLFGVGYPRLCNGANLAYRKDMYLRAAEFRRDSSVASGDDEFLMHSIVYRLGGNAVFATEAEAIVRTEAAPSLAAFLSQRARWASKGVRYDDARFVSFLVLLFLYFVSLLLAPLAVHGSVYSAALFTLLLVVKCVLDLRILVRIGRLTSAPVRLADVLAAELLHPAYIVIASIAGSFWNISWKNRRIRTSRR